MGWVSATCPIYRGEDVPERDQEQEDKEREGSEFAGVMSAFAHAIFLYLIAFVSFDSQQLTSASHEDQRAFGVELLERFSAASMKLKTLFLFGSAHCRCSRFLRWGVLLSLFGSRDNEGFQQ